METPIGDDDDSHLGDFIEDTANTAPIDAAMYASLRDVTKDILDGLTPREAKVLRMRFGIEMNTDHTLEEVGKQFDVTRERIRQIEAKALRKLQHPSRSEQAAQLHRLAVSAACPPPQARPRARVGPGFFCAHRFVQPIGCNKGCPACTMRVSRLFGTSACTAERCQLSFSAAPGRLVASRSYSAARAWQALFNRENSMKASTSAYCWPRPCCAPAAPPTCVRRP